MHAALGNHFAIEMREFFDEPDILQQRRTARPRGLRVDIVGDGCAGGMSQWGFTRH
jgi:hypothetical protein